MTPDALIQKIESLGGLLRLKGESIHYELPLAAAPLLADLKTQKGAVVQLLRARCSVPAMPPGVRLLNWQPRNPPVVLNRWSVVTDARLFIEATLRELDAAPAGRWWLAGNWSVRELVDRSEQVGVKVEVCDHMGNIGGGQRGFTNW